VQLLPFVHAKQRSLQYWHVIAESSLLGVIERESILKKMVKMQLNYDSLIIRITIFVNQGNDNIQLTRYLKLEFLYKYHKHQQIYRWHM